MANRWAVMLMALVLFVVAPCADVCGALENDGQWIRPKSPGAPLIWGRTDGLVFGLPSEGGMGGPRGLIRVGIPGRSSDKPELINFIAIEPVAKGGGPRNERMALSELEKSRMDPDKRGKRLWTPRPLGELTTYSRNGQAVECLSVRIEVEPFSANKTHVYLVARVFSDRPNELALEVYNHDDSAAIDELTLTATMGNYERLRRLWLKGRVVDSRGIYAGYTDHHFVEKKAYPLSEMLMYGGDALAIATANEPDPAAVKVDARHHWTYKSQKLTQYWRVPGEDIQPNLRVRVNGRRVYWQSDDPIPGGIAFENFEVRQRYVPGQRFVFGLTSMSPEEWKPAIPGLTLPTR